MRRLLGWLALIGFGGLALLVVATLLGPCVGIGPTAQTASWQVITFTDKWGEPAGKGAVSRWTEPDRRMSFPYGRVRARLMVEGPDWTGEECDPVFVRFSEAPNLLGGDIRDGYTTHRLRAKWNSGAEFTVKADQNWGGRDLVFSDGKVSVPRITGRETLAVALNWYDQGHVVWQFPLEGAGEALAAAGCR